MQRPLKALWLLLCGCLVVAVATFASEPPLRRGAEVVGSPLTPRIVDVDLRQLPPAPGWRPGDPVDENETHSWLPGPAEAGSAERQTDPLVERQLRTRAVRLDTTFATPLFGFDGRGYGGTNPPDSMGDVGRDHYIQAVKEIDGTVITVYDKLGNVLVQPFLLESIGTGDCSDGWGDPVVLYDRDADRWLISEFSFSPGNRLCIYISRTADPVTGGWYQYDFRAPSFPDYPKYAVWPDAYYVSTREDTPALYAFDRARMLQGLETRPVQRFTVPRLDGFTFQALVPADRDGPTPPPHGAPGLYVRHRDDEMHDDVPDATRDFLEIYAFSVDWHHPASSLLTGPLQIPVSEFDSSLCPATPFSCFDQPGSAVRLSPQREVVMWRPQYRNFGSHEAIVGNFVTEIGPNQGGIRWFELRRSGAGGWSLHQEGTFAIDGADRWLGSIAQDENGNIAMVYNVVDESEGVFPGLRYAGRTPSDPLGTLPQGEHLLIEGSASNERPRYGDYASLNVDPADDCTFWYTGEYNQTELWSTRIAGLRFDDCAAPAPGPVLSVDGTCGGEVTVTVSGATPNSEVAVIPAANLDGFTFQAGQCAGTVLEIGEPFRLPPSWVRVDGSGSGSAQVAVPANRCWLEGLDFASCATSEAVSTSP